MNDENNDLIEELDDDFIDDYSDEEIIEEPEEEIIEYIEEEPSNDINEISQSYTVPNENINIPQYNNNINNNLESSSIPKNIPNNGYSPNKMVSPQGNSDLKSNLGAVSDLAKSSGSSGVPEALTDKKMNIPNVQNESSSKSETSSTDSNEDSQNSGESVKEKVNEKVEEAKSDAQTVAKGAAEIAAGDKVQGFIDLAPVALKRLKEKIILQISLFFIGLFVFAAIFFAIIGPMQESLEKLKEFWNGVTEFSEKTNNMYSGLGFKTTEEAFYEELDDIYNDNFGDVNLALIMSALYYPENDNDYETDYAQTDDSNGGLLDTASGFIKNSSDDKYTQGKILRARILSKGMTEETDGEKVPLEEFIRLYSEQMTKDTVNSAEPLLGALLTYTNPTLVVWDTLKKTYNAIEGPTYVTASDEIVEAFSRILETETLGLKTVSSIDFEWHDEAGNLSIPPKIYVTMRVKAYDEEKFKQFLATKYIPKMPEFKQYINNLTGIARDQEIERIIKEIYERESWYTDVYGRVEGSVENNDNVCVGSIESELLTKLVKPVNIAGSVSFNGEYAYGISNGKLHNGVDLNSETSGTKEGDDVFAVASGKVIEVDMGVSCNTSDDSSCSENGSYVALLHDISVNGTSYTFITFYANLKSGSNSLKVGDKVKKGNKIGKVGKTGNAKIAQLHFAFLKGQSLNGAIAIDPTNLFIECNTSQLIGDDIPEKIWWFLINSGYSKISTAAAMGNIQWESGGFNPAAIEGGTGIGFGLCQWSYGRRTQLEKYAKKMGKKATDLLTQLEFLLLELKKDSNSKYANWQWAGHSQQYETWLNAKNESSLNAATEAFCFGFERPDRTKANLATRQQYAKEIYNKYKNKAAPSTSSVPTNSKNLSTDEKLKLIYPNGVPKNKKGVEGYLTTIAVPITTKSGKKTTMNVTVHKAIAGDVKAACQAAQNEGFVIYSIGGYREYNNGDNAGKVRNSAGQVVLNQSQHNYGLAVDINPTENGQFKNGAATGNWFYSPGSNPYSILPNSALIKSFKSNGWGWGGDWNSSKDYMHFSYFGT